MYSLIADGIIKFINYKPELSFTIHIDKTKDG